MAVKNWSSTAADNVSGLTGINWNEGMNAAAVNDSARGTLAQIADWYAQIKGGTIYPASIGGTANAITLTCSPTIDAYAAGQRFLFKATNTNTAATTINVDGLGAKSIKSAGQSLDNAAITAGDLVLIAYDGTNFQIISAQRGLYAGLVSLKWFGAVGDGSTDDYAAISDALTFVNAAGGTLYVPPGTYAIASATSSSLSVSNDVTILGAGRDLSVFKITGSDELNDLFVATDPNNVWFRDVGIYGNSVSTNNGASGAIKFLGSTGASADMSNFGCVGVHISNFMAPYWVWVLNESAHTMNAGRFIDCSFTSYSGNMINSADIGYPSVCISFWGQWSDVGGLIYDMVVDRMHADCTYIKSGVAFWSGIDGGAVLNSTILSAGANASDNCGGYGSFAYLNDQGSVGASAPKNITWRNNVIKSPRSNGIYSAQLVNGVIDGNRISGQSDTSTGNPDVKAAIGLGLIQSTVVINNVLDDNYCGIIIRGNGTTRNVCANNIITSSVNSATGIVVKGQASFTTDATKTFLVGNEISLTGTSANAILIRSVSGSSATPGYVKILGGRYAGTAKCISTFDSTTSGGVVSIGVDIDCVYLGGTPAIALQHQSTATPISIRNSTVDAASWSGTINGLDLRSATVLFISDLMLKNRASGSGVMLQLTGAQGSMSGVQFYNVGSSQRVTSTDFGTAVPTWSAVQGTFIQNLKPTGSGHLHGYTNTSSGSGTTWTED